MLFPLYESRAALGQITKGVLKVRPFVLEIWAILADLFLVVQDIFAKGSGRYVRPMKVSSA